MLNIGYRQLSWPGEHSILTIHNLTEDKLTAFSLLVDSCSGEFYTQRFTILMKLSHCLHINWKQITLLQLLQRQSSSSMVRKNRRDKLKREFMRSILPRWINYFHNKIRINKEHLLSCIFVCVRIFDGGLGL